MSIGKVNLDAIIAFIYNCVNSFAAYDVDDETNFERYYLM
jgi:hypothetical protein